MSVLVTDISRYQMAMGSTGRVDFSKMYAHGVRGIIFRAIVTGTATGDCGKDWRLDDYVEWLGEYNELHPTEMILLAGYYGAIRLERSISMQIDQMSEALLGKPAAHKFADIEGAPPYGLTPYQAGNRLYDWMVGTGSDGIYTRASWFNDFIQSSPRWSAYFLWAARFPGLIAWNQPAIDGPWSDGKFPFDDWNKHTLWQYGTPSVGRMLGVESEEIDTDLWPWTELEFAEWVIAGVLPPSQPMAIVRAGTNIRVTPNGIDWGDVQLSGSPHRLPIEAIEKDAQGKDWYKLPAYVASWVVGREG